MNRTSLSFRATWRTRSSPLGALCPALSPERVALAAFPSGDPLPPPPPPPCLGRCSAASQVRRDRRDFPRSCITGLRPGPSPHDPPSHHHRRVIMGPPGSRVRRFRTCTGSSTPRGPPTARENAADDVAFRIVSSVGTPDKDISRLNSPACSTPTDALPPPSRTTRTAWGHRGSLPLRCWTLSFLSPDRFIPALPTQILGHSPPHR